MRAASIVVPGLVFASFLLLASGSPLWAMILFFSGFFLFFAFPYGLAFSDEPQVASASTDRGAVIGRWVRRIAKYFVFFWVITQPEFSTFLDRVTTGGALWDWRLIAPLGALALYYAWIGWRRVPDISDQAIFTFLNKDPRQA